MTKGIASAVYDILVRVCGAHEGNRDEFVIAQIGEHIPEWRFGGELGFGGKFWRNDGRLYVSCYPEDRTPKRDTIINDANQQLALLSA